MKSFKIFILLMVTSFIIIFSINRYENYRFEKKVERVNNRIKELLNEGYSLKASQHISAVENGMKPRDKEYNSLIED